MPDEVRALRARLGLSREQMARMLDTTAQSIYRWESGKVAPSPLAVRALREIERTWAHQ